VKCRLEEFSRMAWKINKKAKSQTAKSQKNNLSIKLKYIHLLNTRFEKTLSIVYNG
jgi:hypothetical protein